MSAHSGPKIPNEGLVLSLDASNLKSLLRSVEVLVVAGGGGGGSDMGGGGGGGGVVSNSSVSIVSGTPITVTVGAGGSGAPAGTGGHATTKGTNGGNSTFASITAIGGGAAGTSYYTFGNSWGNSGGSGGGGSGYNNGVTPALSTGTGFGAAGEGTAGQGNRGGWGQSSYYSAGGGGAGGAGTDANSQPNGGPGVANSILGVTYFWGGGGGGASYSLGTGGNGGIGGGGGGAVGVTTGGAGLNPGSPGGGGNPNSQTNTPGGNGGANTGGGGGGGSHYNFTNKGGDGGSGIVIIRYAGPQTATGGTVTSVNGYTIHTFTSVGTSSFTVDRWNDLSGNGNTGTLVNGPTRDSAYSGSLVFDGVNDYVTLGNIPTIGTGDFTINCWVYLPSVIPTTCWRAIATIGNGYTTSGGITLYAPRATAPANTAVAILNAVNPTIGGTSDVNNNIWHHIVLTRVSNNLSIYVDSILEASISNTANITQTEVTVGRDVNCVNTYYQGSIAHVSIYTRGLSAEEVQQNFNALRGRFGV